MTHTWQTDRCNDFYVKDSCEVCGAKRTKSENTDWK